MLHLSNADTDSPQSQQLPLYGQCYSVRLGICHHNGVVSSECQGQSLPYKTVQLCVLDYVQVRWCKALTLSSLNPILRAMWSRDPTQGSWNPWMSNILCYHGKDFVIYWELCILSNHLALFLNWKQFFSHGIFWLWFSFPCLSQIFSTSPPIQPHAFFLFSLEKAQANKHQNKTKQTQEQKKQRKITKNIPTQRYIHIHKPHKNTKSEKIVDKHKTTNINNNNNPPKQTKNPEHYKQNFKKIKFCS